MIALCEAAVPYLIIAFGVLLFLQYREELEAPRIDKDDPRPWG